MQSSREHQLRVLAYLERADAQRPDPAKHPSDSQMSMRLIGEVKPLAGTKAAGRKPRRKKSAQPALRNL
jgi:hypothetical protein